MIDRPACARCERVVPLCYGAAEGRVCSNCRAILKAERCGCCGEVRRVAMRGGDGRSVCGTCLSRQRRGARDAASRRRIIDAVCLFEPGLDAEVIESALDTAVRSPRSLRRLAAHIDNNPQVFTVGPTSTIPALDRLTETLVASGAKRIAGIHPICEGCQRPRRRKARTPRAGSVQRACPARSRRSARCAGSHDASGAATATGDRYVIDAPTSLGDGDGSVSSPPGSLR